MTTENSMLLELRRHNTGLALYSVFDKEFEDYGKVLPVEGWEQTLDYLEHSTPLPEAGTAYTVIDPELTGFDKIEELSKACFGGAAVEAGYCNGRSDRLNALEYHDCSEINIAPEAMVLMMAKRGDIVEGHLDSAKVKAFFLPAATPVEVYSEAMHFAPCNAEERGYHCLVVLALGTNTPLTDTSADPLLWKNNKWLIAHEDSAHAAKGAYVGITGENLQLKLR